MGSSWAPVGPLGIAIFLFGISQNLKSAPCGLHLGIAIFLCGISVFGVGSVVGSLSVPMGMEDG